MDPYTGEIKMFAGIMVPTNWKLCDGSVLNVSDFPALYSLLGNTYGGNGTTTFGLPDLRGRVMVGQGTGANPALTPRSIGQAYGAETVTLQQSNLPLHSHTFNALTAPATAPSPDSDLIAANAAFNMYTKTAGTTGTMINGTITPAGNASPAAHVNTMPSLCINFIICFNGIYPTRP